ncbi:MAG: hypothetical protein MUO31_05845 [Thermodesulfovibrionales bacterium]|nr:hypothetical protein [Thermodesulfovibrionales bacterium]
MFHEKLNLEKIKDAIDALSDEEFHDLETWMASLVDEDEEDDEAEESENFDPDFWRSTGPHSGPGGGEY